MIEEMIPKHRVIRSMGGGKIKKKIWYRIGKKGETGGYI